MINVLANDGISNSGVEELKKSGFNIITTNVAQEQLENYIMTLMVQAHLKTAR